MAATRAAGPTNDTTEDDVDSTSVSSAQDEDQVLQIGEAPVQQKQQPIQQNDQQSEQQQQIPVFPPLSNTSEIDDILQRFLIGFSIDKEFPEGRLEDSHPFSWKSFLDAPKELKGEIEHRGSFYKTMKYECLHTGGFVRLVTKRGRIYWNAQNEQGHRTPDWKLHFSVSHDDIGMTWNILSALFMECKCEIGMKAWVMDDIQWSSGQHGREVTVYIYKFAAGYTGYMQGICPDIDSEIFLGPHLEEIYGAPFWYGFIKEAERRLLEAGIKPRGCAHGDLSLPGCVYTSLRNEAFVHHNGENVYPPNTLGWNAANHMNPFLDVIFFLRAAVAAKAEVTSSIPG